MSDFIDTRRWPLAHLHMPAHVPDADADRRLGEIAALYARAEPFVLIMDGVDLPRHSARFVTTYAAWSRDNAELQRRYCLGAVRVAADPAQRRASEQKAQAWRASDQSPYPYVVVATPIEADIQAEIWITRARLLAAA